VIQFGQPTAQAVYSPIAARQPFQRDTGPNLSGTPLADLTDN
jgi:hypothetical protein